MTDNHIWALVFGASTPLSYIVRIMATHLQAKAFVGSRGWGVGGGTILYKTFSDFYIFHDKNDCSSSKYTSWVIKNEIINSSIT